MQQCLNIPSVNECKRQISDEALSALRRAVRTIKCNRLAAAYAGGKAEGVTPAIAQAIRDDMVRRGQLTQTSYMRNLINREGE